MQAPPLHASHCACAKHMMLSCDEACSLGTHGHTVMSPPVMWPWRGRIHLQLSQTLRMTRMGQKGKFPREETRSYQGKTTWKWQLSVP